MSALSFATANRRAVVLVSGGMDSAVTLALACAQGLDCHALSVAYYDRLRQELPGARFVPMFRVAWELRLIKSPAEIARIARAATILDQTMREVIAAVADGFTARQAAAIAARRLVIDLRLAERGSLQSGAVRRNRRPCCVPMDPAATGA